MLVRSPMSVCLMVFMGQKSARMSTTWTAHTEAWPSQRQKIIIKTCFRTTHPSGRTAEKNTKIAANERENRKRSENALLDRFVYVLWANAQRELRILCCRRRFLHCFSILNSSCRVSLICTADAAEVIVCQLDGRNHHQFNLKTLSDPSEHCIQRCMWIRPKWNEIH